METSVSLRERRRTMSDEAAWRRLRYPKSGERHA